jgi:hypothetical protein
MKLEFNHLKRCGVLVAHEIADQGTVITHRLGSGSIRHSRSLHYGRVTVLTGHGIYEADGHFGL